MLLSCSTFGFSQWVLDDTKAFSTVSFANLRMSFFLIFITSSVWLINAVIMALTYLETGARWCTGCEG